MANIIIALSRPEECTGIRNILARSGYRNSFVCLNGAQALSQMDDLDDGIVVCSYKLQDMLYSELHEKLPNGFVMLLITSQKYVNEIYEKDIIVLSMPLKVENLINEVNSISDEIERKRRRDRLKPKERSEKDLAILSEAKGLLMSKKHMTEEDAHRYIQRTSMETGNGLVETAKMVIALLNK